MDNRFLLTCECGRRLAIDPGQTGQELTCACGQKVQAPGTLQELRKLPRATSEEPTVPAAEWDETPRTIFGCGSLVVMIGLVIVDYFGYQWSQIRGTEKPDLDHGHDHSHENFDQLTPSQILEIWQEWGKELPPTRDKPAWIFWREVSTQLMMITLAGAGVVILGIGACIAASFLVKPPKKEP